MTVRFRASRLAVLAVLCALLPSAPLIAGPVNINTADAATLARELKGIGLARAQAIVEYRTRNGPFRSPEELALVKGIGPKAIENNRGNIRVDARPVAGATPASRKPPTVSRP